MTKYYCDRCGAELKIKEYGIVRTDLELHKFTVRKDGTVQSNYIDGGFRKGVIDMMLCHKCGDECEKALMTVLKKEVKNA